MQREIITTGDGSHTVRLAAMNVTYHSHHGAVQESMHVFIEAGLRHWLVNNTAHQPTVRIFEMGFGTGLNAYLTALEAKAKNLYVHYTAVEKFPLTASEADTLNYAQSDAQKALFTQLHQSAWDEDVFINEVFTLCKKQISLIDYEAHPVFDIIYFDAFAPAAQPELWTIDIFKKAYNMMAAGGVLVTYCSKGVVRRAMQAAGFTVEKIAGPPGKREMVRALKQLKG